MHTLINELAAKMRQPVSIAFRLVKLGYFTDLEAALRVVDSILGRVPHRRN